MRSNRKLSVLCMIILYCLLLKTDKDEHLNKNLQKTKSRGYRNIVYWFKSNKYITCHWWGRDFGMVFRIHFNICFYKVGCRKLFPVEYGVRGVHFQKRRKEVVPLCNKNQCWDWSNFYKSHILRGYILRTFSPDVLTDLPLIFIGPTSGWRCGFLGWGDVGTFYTKVMFLLNLNPW